MVALFPSKDGLLKVNRSSIYHTVYLHACVILQSALLNFSLM